MARQRPTKAKPDEAEAKPSRLAGFGDRADKSMRFDWGEADPVLLAGVVVSVTRHGGLASFGYTRDGGAGTLTVFLDDERSTEYFKPGADTDAKLGEVVDYFYNLP
jgi:hypothetical protein